MTRKDFWRLVQESLDQRLDPIHDPKLQEYLLDNPEDLEELVALRANLQLISGTPKKRSIFRVAIAAAALLLLALPMGALWILGLKPADPNERAPLLEVLDYEIQFSSTKKDESINFIFSPEGSDTSLHSVPSPLRGKENQSKLCSAEIEISTRRRPSHE